MLGNFSAIISSNISSGPFSPSSASGTPIMKMLVCLMLSWRSLNCFHSFFLYSVPQQWLSLLSSSLLILSSASFILLLIPSSVFVISVIVFNSGCSLYFLFVKKTSCNFLLCASILFLSFWLSLQSKVKSSLLWALSQVDRLFALYLVIVLGFYLVPSSETYSFAFSFV